ncbi:MAG: hypothetical protein HY038_04875 [Nitrospirae bacterium]|nr:hypothetical protein [Nitrospirota bacterium]
MAVRIVTTICGLYALLILSGCSIAMALSGQKEPNFDYITVGAPRNQVEAEFGQPTAAHELNEGKKEATYEYEMANSPNSGRAWVNFYTDLATLGLAEPILTVIELIQPHDEETRIVYGPDGRVLEIHGYAPPPISKVVIDAEDSQDKYIERRRKSQPVPKEQTTPPSPQ